MKTAVITKGSVSVFLLAAFIFIFAAPSILPQNQKTDIDPRFINNLNVGIESSNEGLRKSCIYFTGLYMLKECVPTLIEQLKKEEIADVKILIALSLYRIGDENGMKAVEKLSMYDENAKVRKMGNAILTEFENNKRYTSN